jgi:hypothetical protein
MVTGCGGSIASGKGIDVLWLLQDTAKNTNIHKMQLVLAEILMMQQFMLAL